MGGSLTKFFFVKRDLQKLFDYREKTIGEIFGEKGFKISEGHG